MNKQEQRLYPTGVSIRKTTRHFKNAAYKAKYLRGECSALEAMHSVFVYRATDAKVIKANRRPR